MSMLRTNVEFAKRIFADRVGNDYVYGGNWSPTDTNVGTDCSGLVIDILDACVNGPRMGWSRHGMSTESWRPIEVGETGPFGTITVASPADFPPDAVVKVALHHGPGGGAASHMWCECDGIRMESNGSDGAVTGPQAMSVYDTSYANDWAYLPGPIVDSGGEPSPMPKSDQYALAIIREGQRRNISRKGICIALTVPFVESGWKMYANSGIPASLALPHDAVGSDHDSVGLFQQRQAWGPLAVLMSPEGSAGLFYDGGADGQRGLTDFDYDSDDQSPGQFAADVQQPASQYRDRYDRFWQQANDLYDRLAGSDEGNLFMALSDAEQRELLDLARQIAAYRRPSRSPLRHLGEGNIDTAVGFDLNTDANVHVMLVEQLAMLGDPNTLALLREVASANPVQYPDRQHDRLLAQAILNKVEAEATATAGPATGPMPGITPTPVPAPMPAPAPVQVAPVQAAQVVEPTGSGLASQVVALQQQIDTAIQNVAKINQ